MCGVNFKHKMQRVTFKEKIMPKQKKRKKAFFRHFRCQTSFFLWKGFSSGQSGITSAKLWRLDFGLGTDKDYKRDNTREKKVSYVHIDKNTSCYLQKNIQNIQYRYIKYVYTKK